MVADMPLFYRGDARAFTIHHEDMTPIGYASRDEINMYGIPYQDWSPWPDPFVYVIDLRRRRVVIPMKLDDFGKGWTR
jgi:hypothetical protein